MRKQILFLCPHSPIVKTAKGSIQKKNSGYNEFGTISLWTPPPTINSETSRKWLTVAIFRKWQDSIVALWIDIAVILL